MEDIELVIFNNNSRKEDMVLVWEIMIIVVFIIKLKYISWNEGGCVLGCVYLMMIFKWLGKLMRMVFLRVCVLFRLVDSLYVIYYKLL